MQARSSELTSSFSCPRDHYILQSTIGKSMDTSSRDCAFHTVHQKLKLPWKGGVLTILGDGEISAPVCDIKGRNDVQLRDFEVMKTLSIVIASIMKKMGYKSNMGLGKFNQGIKKLPEVYTQNAKCKYGLGYKKEMGVMPKNKYTLNGNFIKLGEDFPYCGFPEPKRRQTRFEIFFKTQLTLEDKA
jgi:hypothetical protein